MENFGEAQGAGASPGNNQKAAAVRRCLRINADVRQVYEPVVRISSAASAAAEPVD